jgi:hypothetical protein
LPASSSSAYFRPLHLHLLLLLQELQGLLWVWPDASAEGAAAAAAAAPALIAELDQPDEWEPRTDWFMREVPISMETVVENVSSPSAVQACVITYHVVLCAMVALLDAM